MNELVKFSSDIVQAFFQDADGGTNAILDMLDEDPSYQTVETFVASLQAIGDDSKRAIGEILAFIRYRSVYATVATFEWDGESPWPDELLDFIQGHYHKKINPESVRFEEWLAWNSYRYDRFWILARKGQIKVWERTGGKLDLDDDAAFDAYLRRLAAGIKQIMDHNTLWAYYQTVVCFPRSQYIPHVSWTTHYVATNLAGAEVDGSLRGLDRLHAKAPHARRILNDAEQRGKATVTALRSRQRKQAQTKEGYQWFLPPVMVLNIQNLENEFIYDGLVFEPDCPTDVTAAMLYYCGLGRDCPEEYPDVYLNDDRLELEDETEIGHIPHADEPVVAKAIAVLAGKMKWKIRR